MGAGELWPRLTSQLNISRLKIKSILLITTPGSSSTTPTHEQFHLKMLTFLSIYWRDVYYFVCNLSPCNVYRPRSEAHITPSKSPEHRSELSSSIRADTG